MDAYFNHVIPEPQVLLGLELKPFCAGHIALLHRTKSVFVTGGEVDAAQLSNVVFLCAQTFEQGRDSLNDPGTPKFLRKWGKQVGKFSVAEKKKEFEAYVARGSEFEMSFIPKADTQSTGHSISEMPFIHSVRCALKHYFHVCESEFWNMPWGLAQWDYFTIPVINGMGDLVAKDSMRSAQELANQIAASWDAQMGKADVDA